MYRTVHHPAYLHYICFIKKNRGIGTFDNISYLASGTTLQAKAYDVLMRHGVISKLNSFDPILVGTMPINLFTEGSDLDIICFCTDKQAFRDTLTDLFQQYPAFHCRDNELRNAIVANFWVEQFEIEIFGQPVPTREQYAYRHMLIEYQVLLQKGADFRNSILELKEKGYKTEPAFAMLLGLSGDPYEALLRLEVV